MNIRLEYLYRDGSNYKRWAEVTFANPAGLSLEELTAGMGAALRRWQLFPDVLHFRPEHVGLATCYFTDAGYESNEDDFELHEIHRLVETADAPTDPRTIGDFLLELAAVPEPRFGARTTMSGV